MIRAVLLLSCLFLAACEADPAPRATAAQPQADSGPGVHFSGYTRFGVKKRL